MRVAVLILLLGMLAPRGAAATAFCQPEEPTPRSDFMTAELARGERYERRFGTGWRLVLEPSEFGWHLGVLDAEGRDLSQWTPPFRGIHPREIFGWHLRNADNTGPNDGSVNAPQKRRELSFSPAPWPESGLPQPEEVLAAARFGRLRFEIVDHGLANLEPGQRARMVWLEFRACAEWPADGWPGALSQAMRSHLRACGLRGGMNPIARLAPPVLEGDLDGTGAADVVAVVKRAADSKVGLVICRGGEGVDEIGFDHPIGELHPDYLERITWWTLEETAGTPPRASIIVGKEGASSVRLYRIEDGWHSQWLGD